MRAIRRRSEDGSTRRETGARRRHDHRILIVVRDPGNPSPPGARRGTGHAASVAMPKKPFRVGTVLVRVRRAVRPYADAAMFALRDAGFRSLFQQLVGCIISIRTRDEVALPADANVLMSFRAEGPKCAHLALGVALGQPRISVDVHVWRVTNRWGYVQAASPDETMRELERKLPRRYWVEINRLLVPFGKHICTGRLPHCSTCPVLDYCRQVEVTAHR
jgi:endonuclease III